MILSALTAIYALLLLVRFALAVRFLRRKARDPGAPEPEVTVLQPILSGDPALEGCLHANLLAHPDARFVWLVDEDDAEGRACAARAAARTPRVTVTVGPPPADGENPKVAKLARALPAVETAWTAVLDDDTVLPPGALRRAAGRLDDGGVACGLPIYTAAGGAWSRLVAGFVNGASLLTYPAADELGAARTLNGMFYVTQTAELRSLGGFDAIRGELTDDYAVAKLYRRAGRPVVQTDVVHPVTTTVTDLRHYAALMRRWMVFADRYLAENRSVFTLGLIGASTLAPAGLLLAEVAARSGAGLLALAAVLALKAGANAWLRRRFAGARTRPVDALFEAAADLLTPLHLAAAAVSPDRITWRRRRMRIGDGRIAYE